MVTIDEDHRWCLNGVAKFSDDPGGKEGHRLISFPGDKMFWVSSVALFNALSLAVLKTERRLNVNVTIHAFYTRTVSATPVKMGAHYFLLHLP